jgi:Domain of unknown function (DUF3399)
MKSALTNAFVDSKKTVEMKMIALHSGHRLASDFSEKDLFQLQHHHLLNCLEKATVKCVHYRDGAAVRICYQPNSTLAVTLNVECASMSQM